MTQEYEAGRVAKTRILEMGLRLWAVNPSYVTARRIANELDMTHSNVLYHFEHSQGLLDAIAFHAVEQGDSRVIAHLILGKHKSVAAMSEQEKQHHFLMTQS